MAKLYNATNPQEIIDQFERMAKQAEVRSVGAAITQSERRASRREMVTWRAAADILRNTEFVGWAAEPPIVDHNAGRASWEKAARAAWDKLQKR